MQQQQHTRSYTRRAIVVVVVVVVVAKDNLLIRVRNNTFIAININSQIRQPVSHSNGNDSASALTRTAATRAAALLARYVVTACSGN